MFGLAGIAASSASAAAPEYFVCAKATSTGKYEDNACSKLASPGPGSYERMAWTHAKKKIIKAKNEGTEIDNVVNPFGKNLQVGEPGRIEGTTTCGKEKLTGELTGPRTETLKATYSNCSALGQACNTEGQKKGTVVTERLESELVWLDRAHTKVGVKVKGLGPNGRLEHFECFGLGLKDSTYGEILVEVQGDNGVASKSVKSVLGEGPLHLQRVGGTYVEEPFGSAENDEKAAKGWWEYEEALLLCEHGKEPFPPGEKSQAACESEPLLHGPNPVPIKPAMLEVVLTTPKGEGVAPAVQTSVSNVKGGAFVGVAEGPFAP
jgi:hypothetical protein